MAGLIEVLVIGAGLAPMRFGRNHNGHLRLLQHGQDTLGGIIGSIREQSLDPVDHLRQQRIRAGEGRGVARREMQAGRIAQRLTGRREFGTPAPAGAAEAFCLLVPPFAPAAW